MPSTDAETLAYNPEAWDHQVAAGNEWTKPVGKETLAAAGARVPVFDRDRFERTGERMDRPRRIG